jgi:LacI family transcriptional regulator
LKHVRPTIFDLERITGFSTGTISRAFNQSTKINAGTRELILKKAAEIGYAPHSGARAMIQGRTRRWGLLLPDLNNPRYAEIMDHLDIEARRRSTLLLLGLSRYDAKVEAELALHWASGEVDGIISDSCVDLTVFEQLRRRRFPIVFLFGRPSEKFDMVGFDASESIMQLGKKIIDLGHRRIGYVSPDFPELHFHGFVRVYQSLLAAHGIPYDEELVYFGKDRDTVGADAWSYWSKLENRPTAVLCFNDFTACNLIQRARADGIRIPEDLSVVGSDDIPVAAYYNLTTIRTNPADIAREVFALLERPHTRTGEQSQTTTAIVERGSIGPVPPAAKPVKKSKAAK